jgi:hypothetical protein
VLTDGLGDIAERHSFFGATYGESMRFRTTNTLARDSIVGYEWEAKYPDGSNEIIFFSVLACSLA